MSALVHVFVSFIATIIFQTVSLEINLLNVAVYWTAVIPQLNRNKAEESSQLLTRNCTYKASRLHLRRTCAIIQYYCSLFNSGKTLQKRNGSARSSTIFQSLIRDETFELSPTFCTFRCSPVQTFAQENAINAQHKRTCIFIVNLLYINVPGNFKIALLYTDTDSYMYIFRMQRNSTLRIY